MVDLKDTGLLVEEDNPRYFLHMLWSMQRKCEIRGLHAMVNAT
jgi:hypothetical protein